MAGHNRLDVTLELQEISVGNLHVQLVLEECASTNGSGHRIVGKGRSVTALAVWDVLCIIIPALNLLVFLQWLQDKYIK